MEHTFMDQTREDFYKSLEGIDVDPEGRYGMFLIEMHERPEGTKYDYKRAGHILSEYGTRGR